MKKSLWIRGINLLLALLLVVSCAACARDGEETPPKDTGRLVIEESYVSYDESFIKEISEQATELLVALIRTEKGIILPKEERDDLSSLLRNDYIPLFADERITPEELREILSAAENLLPASENRTAETTHESTRNKATAFSSFYQNAVAIIGTRRAGNVLYEGLCIYLNTKIDHYEARYEQYGYPYYLASAQEYKTNLNALTATVGKETFSEAVTVLSFSTSLAAGLLPLSASSQESVLFDGDIQAALRRQTEYFVSLGITEEQWYAMGSVLSLLVDSSADELHEATAATLTDEGYFARLARSIPSLLTFYRAFAQNMTLEQMAILKNTDTEKEYLRAISQILTDSSDELSALLTSLESNSTKESEGCRKLMEAEGMTAELDNFLKEYPEKDMSELLRTIACHAEGSASDAALRKSVIGYARTLSPYLTFALYVSDAEDNTNS